MFDDKLHIIGKVFQCHCQVKIENCSEIFSEKES